MKKTAVLRRILEYLGKHWLLLLLAALLTGAANVLSLIAPDLSGKAIDAIIGPGNVDFGQVFSYAGRMLLCYGASAALSFALSLLMIHISRKVVYQMRRDAFEHLADLPTAYFDKNSAGDLVSRLSYDIDTINASISNDLVQIAAGSITVIGSAVMMFRYAPVLMLVFAVTVPCLIFFTRYRVRKVKPLFRRRSAKLGELNGYVEEMLSGLRTIRAYSREEEMLSRFDRHNDEAVEAYYQADYQGSVVGPSVNFINNLSLSLISMFGALLFLKDPGFTIGHLSSFVQYSRRFSGPINETANIISEIQSAFSAAERVFRLLDEDPETLRDEGTEPMTGVQGRVELDRIDFSYVPGVPVLKNISAVIERGSTTAIVGPTGSGKTTIINLLMRFYDPDSGQIRLDGRDTRTAPLKDVRRSFAMVLQDTWLFRGTIAENIAYGAGEVSPEKIRRAAQAARIDGYIMSLPQGYETVLDEDGLNISKGQKQLLTIARAILMDCPVLIMDEATSNVDSQTERRLQEAMQEVMKGRTCILVAHRLSTIQNADQILVIRDGILTECGRHEELLQKPGGFYRALYNSQFES